MKLILERCNDGSLYLVDKYGEKEKFFHKGEKEPYMERERYMEIAKDSELGIGLEPGDTKEVTLIG